MTHARRTAPLALLALLAACGGDGGGLPPAPGADTGPTPDTGGSDTSTPSPDGGTDTGEQPGDVEDDAEELTPEEAFLRQYFLECQTTADCGPAGGSAQICVEGVCVIPPTAQASLAEQITEIIDPDSPGATTNITVIARPEEPVLVGCYADGSLEEVTQGPATATLEGFVERFGSGPATNGLCMVAYDNDALLRWLINSDCADVPTDDELLYVGCYQLDPCRCEEAFQPSPDDAILDMIEGAEAALGARIDSVDACQSFIGNCNAIEDAGLRAACTARVREKTGSTTLESLVIGSTRSQPNDINPDWGFFEIPNVPTNTPLAFKVSGRENRWIDTYEYGLFARAGQVEDGRIRIDSNIVSDGTWRTIPPTVGFAGGISPLNGAVAGAVRDCGVSGGRAPWNVVGATVGISFESNSTVLSYFNGIPNNRLPQPGRPDTNLDGLFAAINLPAGPNRVAPIICTANCDGAGGEPVFTFAGGRNVFQTPKSIIIATFEGIFEN